MRGADAYVALLWIAVLAVVAYAVWVLAGWVDRRNQAVREGREPRVFAVDKLDEYAVRIARRKLVRTGQRVRAWWLKDHEPGV